jgi:imidazolonepropionase
MGRTVLIRGARQLLTLHGPSGPRRGESMRQLGVIEDGAILITDGIISNVGPSRRIENLAGARSAEEISASGRVVMPGFVDCHTHLIAAPPRVPEYRGPGGAESNPGRKAAQYSAEHVRRYSASALEHHAKKMLHGFLRHGTTTVEIKSGYGLDETGELKMLRAISHLSQAGINVAPTFMAPHAPPPEFSGTLDQHVDWIRDHLLVKIKHRKAAQFVDVFCDAAGFNLAQANALLIAARRLGFAIKLHAENTTRMGSVRMGVELGAVSVDGLNHSDLSDAVVLGQSRTVGVIMPGPVYQGYASRFAPARQLMDQGAALALASCFNPPVSSTYNMATVIALACTHMGFTPEEAITAATINAAYALTRAAQSGSLEFGKDADLIMLGVPDYREIPYQFGVNLVSLTMRKGEIVYREGAVSCDGK